MKDRIVSDFSNYEGAGNTLLLDLSSYEAKQLKEEGGLISVEEDKIVEACGTEESNSSTYHEEWNIQAIHADEVPTVNRSDRNVRVAVIDSGMDETEELNIVDRINLADEGHPSELFEDVTQHGTSVAGIIASKGYEGIEGVNPNVDLYSAKVLDDTNVAPISRVVEAIYWAIEKDVDIINMSFGTPSESEALRQAVKAAYDNGILLIAAAGNGKDIEYPAGYEEVVAVGAVDTEMNHKKGTAQDEDVELVAPGEKIKSLGYFGDDIIISGTSMAVPHVTGAAALLWQQDLSKSNEFIRGLLNASARELGIQEKYGNGLVDVKYAMDSYNEYEKEYRKNPNQKRVPIKKNTRKIKRFSNVNYVEGSWTGDKHESMVPVSTNPCIYEDNKINSIIEGRIIKWGAKHADNDDLVGAEDDKKLGFHGYGNYIANYIYLTRVALNNGSRTGVTLPIAKTGKMLEIYNVLGTTTRKTIVEIVDKEGFFSQPGYEYCPEVRGLIIFGFALHTATDAYAHKTKIREDGQWKRLVHNGSVNVGKTGYTTDADDPTKCEARVRSAYSVVRRAIKRFNSGQDGTYGQFVLDSNYYNGTYLLENLLPFAQAVSSLSATSSNGKLLKSATYTP